MRLQLCASAPAQSVNLTVPQQGARPAGDGVLRRISASDLENTLEHLMMHWLPNKAKPIELIQAIYLREDGLWLDLLGDLKRELPCDLGHSAQILHADRRSIRILVSLQLPLRGGKQLVIAGSQRPARPDTALIAALRKAHRMLDWSKGRPSLAASPASIYDRQILRLALLAPDLQTDILAGRQPPTLTLEALKTITIPIGWKEQRETLGWNR